MVLHWRDGNFDVFTDRRFVSLLGSILRSILGHLGRKMEPRSHPDASWRPYMAIWALPLWHVDFLCFFDGFGGTKKAERWHEEVPSGALVKPHILRKA